MKREVKNGKDEEGSILRKGEDVSGERRAGE